MRSLDFQNAAPVWEQGWPSDYTNLAEFYPEGYNAPLTGGNGLSGVGCVGCSGDCQSCGLGAPRQSILKPGKPRRPAPYVPYTPPPLQPGASYIWTPGTMLGAWKSQPLARDIFSRSAGGYRGRAIRGLGFAPGEIYLDEPFPWLLVAGALALLLLSEKKKR